MGSGEENSVSWLANLTGKFTQRLEGSNCPYPYTTVSIMNNILPSKKHIYLCLSDSYLLWHIHCHNNLHINLIMLSL